MAEIAENEVLIAGGFNFDLEKSTYIMDLTTGQTTKTGSLSKGRMNSACEFFNGMVYLVADGETEVYDPMTKLWKQGPTFPTKSQYHGNLIVIQNDLFYTDMKNVFKLKNEQWNSVQVVDKPHKGYVPFRVVMLDSL